MNTSRPNLCLRAGALLDRLLKAEPGVSLGARAMEQAATLVCGFHEVEIFAAQLVIRRRIQYHRAAQCTIRTLAGEEITTKFGGSEDEAVELAYSAWERNPGGPPHGRL